MENIVFLELIRKTNKLLSRLIRNQGPGLTMNKIDVGPPVSNLKSCSLVYSEEKYLDLLLERKNNVKNNKVITSGFVQLDEIINGFCKGELIVIGGRPGFGKTSMILSMIHNQMMNEIPVAIYSLELTQEELLDRYISLRLKIPITRLKAGKLTDNEYDKVGRALLTLSKSDLFLISGTYCSPESFSNMIGSLINEKNVKILYIDYLQLMRSFHSRRNREQEVSDLMRTLKSLALEYQIPIVLTSQMNRYVEMRGGSKRPFLADLRDSGSIEEIADKVLLIYRAENYGITMDEEGNSTDGRAELIVAKNRVGSIGDLVLLFNKNFGIFENISWDKKVFPSLNLPDNPFNESPPFI